MSGFYKAGFEVECPCCHATFEARRTPTPGRVATAESVARVPPTVLPERKGNLSKRVKQCEHCGQDYRPTVQNWRRARFCSRSCSRRNYLAGKNGLNGVQRWSAA